MAKKKKKKPSYISGTRKPENMTLEQWQISLRKQAAANDMLSIAPIDEEYAPGEYRVENILSRGVYKVVYRGAYSAWNYCSCYDFKTSGLGTCKHIEAVKMWLPKHRKFRVHTEVPAYTSVYVDYQSGRQVKIRIGSENRDEFRRLAADYFNDDCVMLPDAPARFFTFLKEARAISDSFRCYDDALDHVMAMRDVERRRRILPLLTDEYLDKLLTAPLFPYQRQGVRFAVEKGRVIIADEMGLGKTIQAIATAEVLRRNRLAGSVIVVCPTSLKYQWKSEIERFAGAEVMMIEGFPTKRVELYEQVCDYKIVSYHTLANDVRMLNQISTDIIIFDEVQRLKNWSTQIAKAARCVKSDYVVALSGTPLENKLEELYSVMELVDQYCLAPFYKFRERYIRANETGKVVGYESLNEIGQRISPFLIRRRKAEVALQMPARQDKILFMPVTKEQMSMHTEFKASVAQIIAKWQRFHFLSEGDSRRLLLLLGAMRMVSDSTFILDQQSRYDVKVEEVANIVTEAIQDDPTLKVVVFSEWERMARLIVAELQQRGITVEYLHGGVPSVKRGEMTERFRTDPDSRVFVSTDAGSTGLNLQTASLLINVDLPWNPAVLEQRIGRIYRYGQQRNIQVINLVSKGTIEERMIDKLRFKQDMFAGVLDGGEDAIFVESNLNKIVSFLGEIIDKEADTQEDTFPDEGIEPDVFDDLPIDVDDDFDDDDFDEDDFDEELDDLSIESQLFEEYYGDDNEDIDEDDFIDDDEDLVEEEVADDETTSEADDSEAEEDTPSEQTPPAADIQPDSQLTQQPTATTQSPAEPPAPDNLIQQGMSFFAGLAQTLQSPEATNRLLNNIVKTDKESGQAYLNIPVPDRDTVQQALTLLTKLFSK